MVDLFIHLLKSESKNRPVRDRLMKLMKTDEIRINDGHYMRKLSRQIERSYEVKLKLKIQRFYLNKTLK